MDFIMSGVYVGNQLCSVKVNGQTVQLYVAIPSSVPVPTAAGSAAGARTWAGSATGVRPGAVVINAPITISAGGTYTGTYQSTNANTPVITISTTQPVTLSRMRIIAKGAGVRFAFGGTNVTIRDCIFEQTNPGAAVAHRAVDLYQPATFIFEYNVLTDTQGVWLNGGSGAAHLMGQVRISNNMCYNIGRYPGVSGTGGLCQFAQLSNIRTADAKILWNHTQNIAGQSSVEDNINLYQSGGTDSSHRVEVANNLIDGGYSRNLTVTNYTGGGINCGDGGGGSGAGAIGHALVHDNVVVSTTNYGVIIAAGGETNDVWADSNLLINDGVEQTSQFGQAIQAWPTVYPPGVHGTNTRYNWKRFAGDTAQWLVYVAGNATGTVVNMTEQQARDEWEARRVAAGVTVGPRP